MKIRKMTKRGNQLTLIVAAAVADLLWLPMVARAQDLSGSTLTVTGSTTLQGDVSVTGTGSVVELHGNGLYFGTATSGTAPQPGVSLLYTDGTTSELSLLSASPSHRWSWGYLQSSGSSAPLMTLDPTGGLTVYDTSGNSVVLSPNTGSGPGTVLTQQVADGRYVSSTDISVGSVTDPWGLGVEGSTIALPGGEATGYCSFAGISSTASGYYSNASGLGSTASGYFSIASGARSTASGYGSRASGLRSTASGMYSTASGFHSTASGYFSTASGYFSTASGYYSNASGAYSTASGYFSTASGVRSTASGDYSTAAGVRTTAAALGEFVVGQFNNISQGDREYWVSTDELFVIGNGTDQQHPSNALVVKKNGDTTINGGLAVSGTAVTTGTMNTIVMKENRLVLIPQQGDLSMGEFVAGTQPPQQ